MRFKQIVLGCILGLAEVTAHADLFISRKAPEVDYLVQYCTSGPMRKCTSNAQITLENLLKARHRMKRARLWQSLAFAAGGGSAGMMPATILADSVYVFHPAFTLTQAIEGITALIKSEAGGLMQVPALSPGSHVINRIVDKLTTPIEPTSKPLPDEPAPQASPEVS